MATSRPFALLFAVAALIAPSIGSAQSPAPSPAPSLAPIHIAVSAATFTGLPRQSVTVTEEDGTRATYSGVLLDAVLVAAGAPSGKAIGGPVLASTVVVGANDGYRVVFALPELDGAFSGTLVLLTDQRNGSALPAATGPYRIVVPAERRHARWVHGVTTIDLVPVR